MSVKSAMMLSGATAATVALDVRRRNVGQFRTCDSMKTAIRKLARAFSAKDSSAFDEALEELEDKVDAQDDELEDAKKEASDAAAEAEDAKRRGRRGRRSRDEGEEPDAVEIHNHIPGGAMDEGMIGAMPSHETAGQLEVRDEDIPPAMQQFAQDCMDAIGGLRDAVGQMQEAMGMGAPGGAGPGMDDDPGMQGPDENLLMDDDPMLMDPAAAQAAMDARRRRGRRSKDEGEVDPALLGAGGAPSMDDDDPDDPDAMDARRGGRRRRRSKDDEANRKILGELEFEAPPGTGDQAVRARDSRFLEDAFQDTLSKAEIMAPGMRLPTFDRDSHPVRTLRQIFTVRRTALDLAYSKADTRGIIDSAMGGRTVDSRRMAPREVRMLFNSVAMAAGVGNNRRAMDTTASVPANGTPITGRITSLAQLNDRNAARYGRQH